MELPIYIRTWHGIDMTQLPAAASCKDHPAGPEVYSEFYAALNDGKGEIPPSWIENKRGLGIAIDTLFEEFLQQHGREPSILAIGAGSAYAEGLWLDRKRDVTLNEWQEDSLADAKVKWPGVKTLIGDARSMDHEHYYDFISLMTMDYTMTAIEFSSVLEACNRRLTPEGAVVVYCASVLSFRQMASEAVKHTCGSYRKTPHLFWGYWRTPKVLITAAEHANLYLIHTYRVINAELIKRSVWKDRIPPLRDTGLLQIFRPKR